MDEDRIENQGRDRAAAGPQPNAAAAGAVALVTVDTGTLAGARSADVERFLGIPFAAAPSGPLRWRPPQPAAAWPGQRAAVAFGNDCVQNRPQWDRMSSDLPLGEDCLYLNVWRPAQRAEAALPVMVWIHGGGFVMGSSGTPVLDGSAIARRGIVVVSFNYRLGRFGFFAHPVLSAAQHDEPLGNYGLMDQIAALRWVRRNIGAFGGDAGNITIFGDSAGGTSVLQLMAIDQARGLFHKAIAQSAGGRDPWPHLRRATHRPSAEAIGERFAREAGLREPTPEALRALPAELLRGGLDLVNMEPDTYSGPMIDGTLVTGPAAQAFAAGHHARVPLLSGFTSNELGDLPAPLRDMMVQRCLALLDLPRERIEALYGGAEGLSRGLVSDFPFAEPARHVAALCAAAGAPSFLYVFDYVVESLRTAVHGAAHATDVPYVFSTLTRLWPQATTADEAQSALMLDYWTQFARAGDPNCAGRPRWPVYRGDSMAFWFGQDGPALRALAATRLDAIEAARTAARN